ncbi:MAG TPA: hypothetical protein VLM89_17555 [Phycisphaerae bacterium]|nr:hypothetical protein [Phycisphaerae bacterium]
MLRLMHGLWSVMLWVGPVLAQTYEEEPPKDMAAKSSAMEWLIAAAFLVGCLVVAFKPAKRSNLK